MGGWRCSYRNCKVTCNGETRMFHFPVFDKMRCYKWLVNAQRLDFLNIRVSQLKNRCICQHHFETENFMNCKRARLKKDTVPTINGPFCDPSKWGFGDTEKYPNICVEDIECDYDIKDKTSILPLKYVDFLTNNKFAESSFEDKINLEDKNSNHEDMPVITSSQSIESVLSTDKSKQVFVKTKPKVQILSSKIIKYPTKNCNTPCKLGNLSPSHCLNSNNEIVINSVPENKKSEITPKKLIVLVKDSLQVGNKHSLCLPINKRTVSTQTNESRCKEFLYQEISKYLSPTTKSLVCEELFMYSNCSCESPSKRRRI